jgi:hypothetical protein
LITAIVNYHTYYGESEPPIPVRSEPFWLSFLEFI